ncbi:hypothetical protein [Amycolatopsis jiangsuensis]|uniref:Uncharacterized protein n=1 Tax=Amycolatopsis jiangsuensis TaxID=1181879 RepID=A0A840INI8_9PSEU|nr:hypothetical protein [Amycolatopsis jiangsuensis]MBB4683015.1 hypothetical protein [Amycolatopsis jiangsuensis]
MHPNVHPVPGPPPTPGPQQTDPRAGIDEAVAGLDDLDTLPPAEHVDRFEAVHTELTVALSSIDKV